MLYHAVDPNGFRWANISRALNTLLDGITERETVGGRR